MKKMACKDMGGPCDMEMSASKLEEMKKMFEEHLQELHPEEVVKMENMTAEEKKKLNEEIMEKWNMAPNI